MEGRSLKRKPVGFRLIWGCRVSGAVEHGTLEMLRNLLEKPACTVLWRGDGHKLLRRLLVSSGLLV